MGFSLQKPDLWFTRNQKIKYLPGNYFETLYSRLLATQTKKLATNPPKVYPAFTTASQLKAEASI